MPTFIIRPATAGSDSGFDVTEGTLLTRISDNDNTTFITQNQVSAGFVFRFDGNELLNATITGVTVSVTGQTSGKASSAVFTVSLQDAGTEETHIDEAELTFQQAAQTLTTAAELSAAPEEITDLQLTAEADGNGIKIIEVFATVEYVITGGGSISLPTGKLVLSEGNLSI